MKKILIALVLLGGVALADERDEALQNLASSASQSAAIKGEKGGVFLGVQGGSADFALNDLPSDAFESRNVAKSTKTLYFGAKLGYQHFFEPFARFFGLGFRGYVGYDDYGRREAFKDHTDNVAYIAQQSVSANIDVLINVAHFEKSAFGLYIGTGLGYGLSKLQGSGRGFEQFSEDVKYHGFMVALNLGVSANILGNHRLELGSKLPLVNAAYKHKPEAIGAFPPFEVKPTALYVGYSYIF